MNSISYLAALELQKEAWRAPLSLEIRDAAVAVISAPQSPIALMAFESHPVWTLGRKSDKARVLQEYPLLQQRSEDVIEVERGGDVTYHGPGQIVLFPVPHWSLTTAECAAWIQRGPRWWVNVLERLIISVGRDFGVSLHSRIQYPGVWTEDVKKVASIGLRFSPGMLTHGASLNLDPRVAEGFGVIDPCGLKGIRATDLSSLSGQIFKTEDVLSRFENYLGRFVWHASAEAPVEPVDFPVTVS